MEKKILSCADCRVKNCYRKENKYPRNCITAELDDEEIKKVFRKVIFLMNC